MEEWEDLEAEEKLVLPPATSTPEKPGSCTGINNCEGPFNDLMNAFPPPVLPCPDFLMNMTPRSLAWAMAAIDASGMGMGSGFHDTAQEWAVGTGQCGTGMSTHNCNAVGTGQCGTGMSTHNCNDLGPKHDSYPYPDDLGAGSKQPIPYTFPCSAPNPISSFPNNANVLPPVMLDDLTDDSTNQLFQELQRQHNNQVYVMPIFEPMQMMSGAQNFNFQSRAKPLTPFDVVYENTQKEAAPRAKRHLQPGGGSGNFVCEYCGHRFKRLYTLNTHTRVHTGAKPYICEICGMGFRQSGTKHNHIRAIHMKERPFQCALCFKSFSHKSTLQVHIRTHTKEKPYPCNICNKRFTDRATYLKHQTVHTGEKPYSCPACSKCFAQKSNLKRHYNNIHHTVI